jgi:hypothetical protein
MSQLRRVLGDIEDPPRYIETVARKGYRLIAPVSTPANALPPVTIAPDPPASAPRPVERRPRRWMALAIAAAVVAAVLIGLWQWFPMRPPLPQMASIVVLPFIDLTDGHTQQMFCDGLTERLPPGWRRCRPARRLADLGLFVPRSQEDVRAIGRELHTSHLSRVHCDVRAIACASPCSSSTRTRVTTFGRTPTT